MNKYLHKIHQGFESVDYHLDSVKELLSEDIDANDIDRFIDFHIQNVSDFYYSLFELDLRLRALRDKLENG